LDSDANYARFLSVFHLLNTIIAQIGGVHPLFDAFHFSRSSGMVHPAIGFLIGANDTESD